MIEKTNLIGDTALKSKENTKKKYYCNKCDYYGNHLIEFAYQFKGYTKKIYIGWESNILAIVVKCPKCNNKWWILKE